ncbi:MAG: nuclear transport factor 2 family protein [Gemmatimonadetes bacterium]|nr:nuclear transport factor 2 family protein [Gemmatimonadota bacterium]
MPRIHTFAFPLLTGLAVLASPAEGQTPRNAREAVEELLATDRRFSVEAAQRGIPEALGAMFAPDVAMQAPQGFLSGRDAVIEALRAAANNQRGSLSWEPIRGGISADGQHGFTFGYMTHHQPGGASTPLKYMAYWVKRAGGWQVSVYKRSATAAAPSTRPAIAPSLPTQWGVALANAATAAHDLASAESAFSDLAAKVGLQEAFRQYGTPDAVNMGGGASPAFVVGADAIASLVSEGETPGVGSALRWGSDRVLVAASGDLGVSIGTIIAPPRAQGGPPARIPFFTIWRRAGAGEPWRYIAE